MIGETLDFRTSLILLPSQRITGAEDNRGLDIGTVGDKRCLGQHLTPDDDTLAGLE
jgi:hypothetical protein